VTVVGLPLHSIYGTLIGRFPFTATSIRSARPYSAELRENSAALSPGYCRPPPAGVWTPRAKTRLTAKPGIDATSAAAVSELRSKPQEPLLVIAPSPARQRLPIKNSNPPKPLIRPSGLSQPTLALLHLMFGPIIQGTGFSYTFPRRHSFESTRSPHLTRYS
jgi:hypothetical protein